MGNLLDRIDRAGRQMGQCIRPVGGWVNYVVRIKKKNNFIEKNFFSQTLNFFVQIKKASKNEL
jgi:hypothetical protein